MRSLEACNLSAQSKDSLPCADLNLKLNKGLRIQQGMSLGYEGSENTHSFIEMYINQKLTLPKPLTNHDK